MKQTPYVTINELEWKIYTGTRAAQCSESNWAMPLAAWNQKQNLDTQNSCKYMMYTYFDCHLI